MSEKQKTNSHLVGGFGGAGGALILSAFFNYLFYPTWRESTMIMNLSFGIIGTLFILTAVFLHLKK